MSVSRRQFLKAIGGTGLLYAVRFSPAAGLQEDYSEVMPLDIDDMECVATVLNLDYTEWIAFGPEDTVSVYTGRTELGQGLRTVLIAIVTQGLDIPQTKLTVFQGDTELCPDDGPTTGSSATRQVGWGFWLACEKIREDLVARASRSLMIPTNELEYRDGGVGRKGQKRILKKASQLGRGQTVKLSVNPDASSTTASQYVDQGLANVNARHIVTGKLKFVGDIYDPGVLYAGWLNPPYHQKLTDVTSVDFSSALAVPGVKMAEVVRRFPVVVAERYSEVLKALDVIKAEWKVPTRPVELRLEEESRDRAKPLKVMEKKGNVDAGLASSDLVLSETYTTQYTTQAPIETDTALARMEAGGTRATVWVSSQYPHKAQEVISQIAKMPKNSIRVKGMPVGGGFGGKTSNTVTGEAVILAQLMHKPVKLLYSRKDQIQRRGRYKEACVVDLTTGVSADGRMLARKIDIIHDHGIGSGRTYTIPHVLTKLYKADWPVDHATSRGTSYVQLCFATESHIDMVAAALGEDPLAFRRNNIQLPALVSVLDASAEMIGYDNYQPGPGEGIGFAVVNHGGVQLGAVAAEVFVNRSTGRVRVKKLCGAFDIGLVINQNTALVGIRGAMIWGLGYVLHEEVKMNGRSTQTADLMDYHIPRFSDIPPVEVSLLNDYHPGTPRGCGEMPMIPVIGAIANAVHRAIGVRFHSTPITPTKVRNALKGIMDSSGR